MASVVLQSLRTRPLLRNALLVHSLRSHRNGNNGLTPRRNFSNQTRAPGFGIAFDIDGVVLRDGEPIGGAPRALQQLYESAADVAQLRVPYVFLTNGGGMTEASRAAQLGQQLGVPVAPDQVLLGHTPFKKLLRKFGDKCVLAVGKGAPDTVLKSYGFQQVVHMDSYVGRFDSIDPLARYKPWLQPPPKKSGGGDDDDDDGRTTFKGGGGVAAVFVVSDPVDWGRDLQVIADVLRSGGHPERGTNGIQTPIYFAADDLEYQSAFPVPRFGMGAFRIALESIYNKLLIDPFVYTSFGKPEPGVYRDAERVLQQIQESMRRTPSSLSRELMHGLSFPPPASVDPPVLAPLKTVYMIGDNPETDIKGAKLAREPWFSVLTRTGCFRGGNSGNNGISADKVVEDVEEAIDFIFDREGLQKF